MEESKPLVLYHGSCADGFTAAWAAHRYYNGNIEAIEVGYNATEEEIGDLVTKATGRLVYVLDFSFPIATLKRFMESAAKVILLDHHKTAREDMEAWFYEVVPEGRDVVVTSFKKDNLEVEFDMERSGAGIAWDHFFGVGNRNWLVDYIEDRDIWTWKLEESRTVSIFLMHQKRTFENWDSLSCMQVDDAIVAGSWAMDVVNDYIEQAVNAARICEIPTPDGIELVPVVNALYFHTSEVLEFLASTPMCLVKGITAREAIAAHKALRGCDDQDNFLTKGGVIVPRSSMVDQAPFSANWYIHQDGALRYSMRSRDPKGGMAYDVSAVAKMYGGGGHHRAAGFNITRPVHEPCPGGGMDLHQAAVGGIEAYAKHQQQEAT
jgi:oligoribonuclease NrnB/cAMP/cGMP phosphodiesterase (DHH superfamily)